MPPHTYFILAAGWIAWVIPFVLVLRRRDRRAQKVDRRARWGMVLEGVSYAVLWQSPFWLRPPDIWQCVLSILLLTLAAVLSWTSVAILGRQWRIDAGLNADHKLVRSGAYSIVRHPIYTSMLCMLLGTGFMVAPLPLLALSLVIFLVGTEIRVRIEDSLLAARFGDDFQTYRRSVAAYIPFLRPRP